MISIVDPIKFSNISYSANGKRILSRVSGEIRPHRLTAVLGPSGSGKTTLLRILSGRLECRSKKVTVGHYNLSQRSLMGISALVDQEDVLPQYETVREAIDFSRRLRNREYPLEDLSDLGLSHIADERVSDLSHGERKRLSVALELVSSPKLVFLDEPTTGADSRAALEIVRCLKRLCTKRTILLSVHQPSSEIFSEFDDVLVLKEGSLVYYGPTFEIFQFFKQMEMSCPNYCNPADFLFAHVLPLCDVRTGESDVVEEMMETHLTLRKNTVPKMEQFQVIYRRDVRKILRNLLGGGLFLFGMILVAALIGGMFYGIEEQPEGVVKQKNMLGLLNFCSVGFIFTSSLGILGAMYEDNLLFLKEYRAGYYTAVPYFFARIINNALLGVLGSLAGCMIILPLVKLDYTVWQRAIFLFNTIFTALIGQCIGLLSSVVLPSVSVSLLFLPPLLVFLALLNGALVDPSGLPYVFRILQRLSPFSYSFSALLENNSSFTGILSAWETVAISGPVACLALELLLVVVLLGLSLLIFWAKTKLRP